MTSWPLSAQDAAEALYDYVVQKDSRGLGDKKMVTRVYDVTPVFLFAPNGTGETSTGAAMRSRAALAARTPGGSTETTRQA